MHPIRCILFIAVAFCGGVQAQIAKPTHEIRLHNGEVYSGSRLVYVSPILRTSEFDLDGRKFESSEIAFFRNNHGYFVNLNRIYSDKAERYAFRFKEGKVNLYEEIEIEVYGGDELDTGDPEARNEMLATGESYHYFNKGDGAIQKANYKNLRMALSDNEESKKELNVIRNYRILQVGMIVAGSGLIAYEFIRQNENANASSQGDVRLTPMIALGIVIGGSSLLLESGKENARWMAADKYNRAEVAE